MATPKVVTLTVTQFAAALQISTRTVERMLKRKEVRRCRLGRRVLIPAAELERLTGRAR